MQIFPDYTGIAAQIEDNPDGHLESLWKRRMDYEAAKQVRFSEAQDAQAEANSQASEILKAFGGGDLVTGITNLYSRTSDAFAVIAQQIAALASEIILIKQATGLSGNSDRPAPDLPSDVSG